MLGTVKGLGERALGLAGLPLRWVGAQLEYGRMQVNALSADDRSDRNERMKILRRELLGLQEKGRVEEVFRTLAES